ncbi:MAG: ABC-2 family transporter protein [Anaerolineae bacterium]
MLNKYLALLRRSMGIMLEYRVSMLIWVLTASFPLVMMAVWLSLAQDGPVGNYTASDFVAYYLLGLYVREMTTVWVAYDLDNDIRHGDLSVKLLHPLNPIHEYIAFNLSDKLMRVIVLTPLVVLAALLVPGVNYVLTPLNILLFLVALAMAWFLRYMIQYVMGLLAFWISQALTLIDIQWMLFLLFGGTVAPIDLLPHPLDAIARFLPFRFMLSFPVELLQGRLSMTDLGIGFAVGLGWVLVFYLLYLFVWRKGLKQFSAFGA